MVQPSSVRAWRASAPVNKSSTAKRSNFCFSSARRRTLPSVSSAARAAAWASPLGFQTLPSSSLSDEDAEDDRFFVFFRASAISVFFGLLFSGSFSLLSWTWPDARTLTRSPKAFAAPCDSFRSGSSDAKRATYASTKSRNVSALSFRSSNHSRTWGALRSRRSDLNARWSCSESNALSFSSTPSF